MIHKLATLMAIVLPAAAINTAAIGANIEYPPVVSSSTTSVSTTLSLHESNYVGPGVTQRTRVYNGGIPGPTIREKPALTPTPTPTPTPAPKRQRRRLRIDEIDEC